MRTRVSLAVRQGLVVHPFPEVEDALVDDEAEREIGQAIGLTRALRRWRDLAGVPVKQVLAARADHGQPHELVSRLARVEFSSDGGEPIASVGGVEVPRPRASTPTPFGLGSRSAAISCAPR